MTYVSDSEASTVPANDADAKQKALKGLKAAQAEETRTPVDKLKRKDARDMDQLSSEPKLPRRLQSKPILREGDETQVAIKKSETSETLAYTLNQAVPTAAKATAVKAKAQPPTTAKCEPETPTSKAVSQCLGRASTKELQAATQQPSHGNTPSTPKAAAAASPPAPVAPQAKAAQTDPDPDSDSESSADDEELRRIEREQKAKREAHARYMRFSRSLTSTLGWIHLDRS